MITDEQIDPSIVINGGKQQVTDLSETACEDALFKYARMGCQTSIDTLDNVLQLEVHPPEFYINAYDAKEVTRVAQVVRDRTSYNDLLRDEYRSMVEIVGISIGKAAHSGCNSTRVALSDSDDANAILIRVLRRAGFFVEQEFRYIEIGWEF